MIQVESKFLSDELILSLEELATLYILLRSTGGIEKTSARKYCQTLLDKVSELLPDLIRYQLNGQKDQFLYYSDEYEYYGFKEGTAKIIEALIQGKCISMEEQKPEQKLEQKPTIDSLLPDKDYDDVQLDISL